MEFLRSDKSNSPEVANVKARLDQIRLAPVTDLRRLDPTETQASAEANCNQGLERDL